MNRLNRGEQIFLGAAGLLFLLSWIKPWAKVDFVLGSAGVNAWQGYGFLGKLVVLLALAGLVLGGLKLAGQQLDMPSVAYVAIGGLATFLLLIMVLTGPADEGTGVVDRGFLLFVGIVLGAAMTYGGYTAMQAEGTGTPPSSGV